MQNRYTATFYNLSAFVSCVVLAGVNLQRGLACIDDSYGASHQHFCSLYGDTRSYVHVVLWLVVIALLGLCGALPKTRARPLLAACIYLGAIGEIAVLILA